MREILEIREIVKDEVWRVRLSAAKRRTIILSTSHHCPCLFYDPETKKKFDCPVYGKLRTSSPVCNIPDQKHFCDFCNKLWTLYPEMKKWCQDKNLGLSDFSILPRYLLDETKTRNVSDENRLVE